VRGDFASFPWGRLDWVLDRLPEGAWDLLGSVSSEERCTAVLSHLSATNALSTVTLIDVIEPRGHAQAQAMREAKALRAAVVGRITSDATIAELPLLVAYGEIVSVVQQALVEGASRLIIDITSLPKRFFFPAINIALRADNQLQDVVIAYARAERYAHDSLHEDAMTPRFLPLFAPSVAAEQAPDVHIVGLGFDAPGLIQVLEGGDVRNVEFLFPLPAPPPFFGRNWDSLRHASHSINEMRIKTTGVSTVDMPAVFEELCACGQRGNRRAVLAPYGPKPVSLAMCLYTLAVGPEHASVIYTQPKYYHPQYSHGVATDAGGPVVYAYPVRLGGKNMFTV
jgi:hypothetical protein